MSPLTPQTSFSQEVPIGQPGIPPFSQLEGVTGGLGGISDPIRPAVGSNLLADLRAPQGTKGTTGANPPVLGNLGSGFDMLSGASMGPLAMEPGGVGVGLEGMGMMEGMNGGGLASSALMSLLGNDGSFDMNALFAGSDFGPGSAGIPGMSGLTAPTNASEKDRDDGSAMVGVIASP